ncbi:hypothetical protein RN001_001671 [Aquatica leii]|uniref:G protein pathway suppressor 2 n=1 Tax=Aquatica leii TaxID=1421715 RepID=A0AAN7PBY8_9COLE|nr:hypothetical protein RN001_001671 [Aquatica leii]
MPAAVTDKSDRSEQMWKALRIHIQRERARKKQEREAEVEEERLRKEREAREQQDVMTLGETREQIQQLEGKLQQLKEEKHQLFLQLKKVLNEDDNRRRQLVKESNDMLTIQAIPSSGLVHQQLFIPQTVPRVTAVPQQGFKAVNKRPRSPSPQPQPAPPTTIYHQGYAYKPPNVGSTTYQGSPQKTSQYPNQQGTFYPPQELSIYYPQGPIPSREPTRAVYESTRPQSYHIEQKPLENYTLRPPSSHAHVIHATPMSLNPAQAPTKPPSITATYPTRMQTQYQQAPPPAPALYTAQNRPLYQSSNAPMNYPPRE